MRTAPHFAGGQPFAGPREVQPQASAFHQQVPPTVHATAPGEVFEGAILFRQLRHLVQLPPEHVAYRLGTTVEVLQALENGHTALLPPWPETMRVVIAYTGFANIDPRPVLSSIHSAMALRYETAMRHAAAANPNHSELSSLSTAPRRAPNLRRDGPVEAEGGDGGVSDLLEHARHAVSFMTTKFWPDVALQSLKQRRVIAALSVTLPLAVLMSLASGGPVQAVASVLPRPVTGFLKSVEDFVRESMAPRRDGFSWINVSDPRSRKTDKLPSPKR